MSETKETLTEALRLLNEPVTRTEQEYGLIRDSALRALLRFAIEVAPSKADLERDRKFSEALAPFAALTDGE